MIQLQRHIEILLLQNECVIVPDFGGFIAHQVSARYDADDHSFLPPVRTLGFNPLLRMNDSVLVQSYVEAYDISYPEALRRIEDEVTELKQFLSENGSYTLEDLGTLTINKEGNYEFTPCQSGILSPELYGLGNFHFKRLKDEEPVSTPVVKEKPAPTAQEVSIEPTLLAFTDDDSEPERTITIKLSWIRNAVAVAAAVVAFFLIATPVSNSDLSSQAMSQLQHNILYKLIPQDTNIVPVAKIADAAENPTAVKSADAAAEETAEAAKNEQDAETEPFYCVVLASQVKQNNAELLVQRMQQEGYEDTRLYIHNNVIRVICGSFQTESEAYRLMNKLNNKEEFADAWVIRVKSEG